MKLDFQEMMAALAPKKEPVEINGFKFYVRPMSVSELAAAFQVSDNKEDRGDLMILACVQHEDGSQVFETLEQVQALYTTVRSKLYSAVQKASFLDETAHQIEKP
ncbi:TPA: cytochrome [Enterobacter hormaechei subsp. steigerwaltii]|nr:cytochrome [Enterobacter cloacae]HAS0892048.1 cytochrome [Enterobacter hormaechei subsp. steigerwaltii]